SWLPSIKMTSPSKECFNVTSLRSRGLTPLRKHGDIWNGTMISFKYWCRFFHCTTKLRRQLLFAHTVCKSEIDILSGTPLDLCHLSNFLMVIRLRVSTVFICNFLRAGKVVFNCIVHR